MDKSWKIGRKRLGIIGVGLALVLCMLGQETVYASEVLEPTMEGPDIKAMTENADSGKRYDIKVEWGDMQFVYDYAIPTWDTETLQYSETGEIGWKESGFNGSNNKIQIENRSNAKIKVGLNVEMRQGVFNETSTGNGVQAHFFETNEQALQASKILEGVNEAALDGKITELVLDSAEAVVDGEGNETDPAGVRTATAYFGFCGTPDKTLNAVTEVGSISLVFTDITD